MVLQGRRTGWGECALAGGARHIVQSAGCSAAACPWFCTVGGCSEAGARSTPLQSAHPGWAAQRLRTVSQGSLLHDNVTVVP